MVHQVLLLAHQHIQPLHTHNVFVCTTIALLKNYLLLAVGRVLGELQGYTRSNTTASELNDTCHVGIDQLWNRKIQKQHIYVQLLMSHIILWSTYGSIDSISITSWYRMMMNEWQCILSDRLESKTMTIWQCYRNICELLFRQTFCLLCYITL